MGASASSAHSIEEFCMAREAEQFNVSEPQFTYMHSVSQLRTRAVRHSQSRSGPLSRALARSCALLPRADVDVGYQRSMKRTSSSQTSYGVSSARIMKAMPCKRRGSNAGLPIPRWRSSLQCTRNDRQVPSRSTLVTCGL